MAESTNTASERSFGRRAFMKGAAASMGLVAATGLGCAPKEQLSDTGEAKGAEPAQAPEEEIYQGICRGNCGGGCIMNVHVREGKIVKTSAIHQEDDLDTRICQRGLTHPQRVYAPERLQYPLRRVEGTERGAGEWERLSWDEAISYIADKWKGYIEEVGPQSITYFFGAGTYSYNYFVWMRLFNLIGATGIEAGYDMAALEQGWRMYGMSQYLIGNHGNDVVDSKYIFTWAHDATIAGQCRWAYYQEAMKRGAKLIVIDPMYTGAAQKADLWVPIKPATDAALALGMMNVIFEEGLTDDAAMKRATSAPYLVKAKDNKILRMSDLGVEPTEGPIDPLTGQPTVVDPMVFMAADGTTGTPEEITDPVIHGTFEVNGHSVTTALDLLAERASEWTPEKTEEVTTVPADTVRELARMFAEGPTNFNIGFGNDHWTNGQSITMAQLTLPLITGQFGKPGAGVGGTQGASTSGWPEANMGGLVFPEGAVGGMKFPINYLPEIMETGKFGETPFPVKCVVNIASNLLGCMAGRNQIREALDKVDLVINVDQVMNDTSRYADIVLPVPHWFEFETINSCPGKWADFNDKAIDPQFECKSDVEIAALLGLALGYEQMNLTDDQFNEILLDTDALRAKGITLEDLREKKRIKAFDDVWLYGSEEAPFVTATGRAEFFIEDAAPQYPMSGKVIDAKLNSLPHYEQPLEAYDDNPLREKYPLMMWSHRDKFKVHSTFAVNPILNEIEPEPTIEVNPIDAEERGIADGDYVRVFNDRGEVTMKAYLDPSMRPGCMWTEHVWLQEQYKDGHMMNVTNHQTRDVWCANQPFDTLVQIEKL